VAIENIVPKIRNFPIVANAERILQSTTDFIRGNPIVSTASVGAGVTGLVVAAATIRKLRSKKKRTGKRKAKKPKKRTRVSKRKFKRTRKKVTHRKPRHRGHKKVSFITKQGKRVSFLVKKPAHSHKIKRRKR